MSTHNVRAVAALHAAFNSRDDVGLTRDLAPGFAYTDEADGTVVTGPDAFARHVVRAWLGGMSDTQISDARYVDGGDTVVAIYIARATNDGRLGSAASKGRRIALSCCEIFHCDADGTIMRGEIYYDRDSLIEQLRDGARGWRTGTLRSSTTAAKRAAKKKVAADA